MAYGWMLKDLFEFLPSFYLFITLRVEGGVEIGGDNWKTIVILMLTVFNYSASSCSKIYSVVVLPVSHGWVRILGTEREQENVGHVLEEYN